MFQSNIAAHDFTTVEYNWSQSDSIWNQDTVSDEGLILNIALDLLESGNADDADNLLTATLLEKPDDSRLWLAAGICRLRKGSIRTAACAFEMSAWLSDDSDARELLALCEEIIL